MKPTKEQLADPKWWDENAPDGATHWMQESPEWLEGFWRRVGTANYFYEKGEWVFSGGKPFGHPKLIAHPSPAWSGDGLPPPGHACEVNDTRTDSWCSVDEVIAHVSLLDRDVAVFRIGDYIAYSSADRFRPIRTKEEVKRNMFDNPTYQLGDLVRKKSGSQWVGEVVGFYSTELTPEGYAVESVIHKGSVQIYPVNALEPVNGRVVDV